MAYSVRNMVEFEAGNTIDDYNPTESEPLDPIEAWKEPYRDRGLLTVRDREYLLGRTDLEGQDERNTRYRVRQRIVHGLHDIILLSLTLPDEDLKQVLKDDLSPPEAATGPLRLAYRILDLTYDDPISALERCNAGRVENAVEAKQSNDEKGVKAEVEVDISVETTKYDINDIFQRLKQDNNEANASREEFWIFLTEADPETLNWSGSGKEQLSFYDFDRDQSVEVEISPSDLANK